MKSPTTAQLSSCKNLPPAPASAYDAGERAAARTMEAFARSACAAAEEGADSEDTARLLMLALRTAATNRAAAVAAWCDA